MLLLYCIIIISTLLCSMLIILIYAGFSVEFVFTYLFNLSQKRPRLRTFVNFNLKTDIF